MIHESIPLAVLVCPGVVASCSGFCAFFPRLLKYERALPSRIWYSIMNICSAQYLEGDKYIRQTSSNKKGTSTRFITCVTPSNNIYFSLCVCTSVFVCVFRSTRRSEEVSNPLELGYRQLLPIKYMLGNSLGTTAKILLRTELSFQPYVTLF